MRMRCLPTALLAMVLASRASAAFDHLLFDKVLGKYVSNGRVNYHGLLSDADFPKYLKALATANASALGGRADQLAFWINAYNASCLNGVLKRYPIASVQKDRSFFKSQEHKVAGATRSLGDIENGILRAKYKDARVHFALNCASASCPALSDSAYTGSKLSSQLDAAAKRFLNDPSRNKFSVTAKEAQLSSLFKWYAKDFGSQSQMLSTLAKYVPAPVAAMLKSGTVKVSYLGYDWSMNGR
ncbi:MAG: DUF547 domain-containing protein [Armatimonadetes bacterium]|nr:DUF547 domain-containing protein [Armatimonadota bacterium]